jgi:hypothetical protein
MAGPSDSKVQNILPVQALFNIDNSFNTFIGQGQPFIVSATESIGIADVTALNATLYPTLSPVSTGQVTSLDVTSTKLTFNPSTGTLSATTFNGALSGTATATSSIANGVAGNIPYQTAPGVTSFITNGSTGQVLTSNGSSAPTWSNPTSSIAITDDTSTNATRYPLFSAATTGSISTEYTSSTRFQFNPSTGLLTATGFSGSGANLTNIPNGALTNSSVTIGSTSISLGSTATTLAGLTSVTSTTFVGALTGNASSATTATTATNATNIAITDDTSTATSVYPTFVTNTTGNLPAKTSSTKLSFVPSTGVLSTTGLVLTNALGVAYGGTGVTSSSGANSVVLRDANGNITTNCLFEGYSTVAASGTTITLTASSAQNYQITGSGGQTIKLPDATTLPNGALFTFNNNQSSGAITVQNNSSTTVATINSGGYVTVVLLSNSTAAGSWDRHDSTPSNVSWSTNTLDYPGSITSATWNGTAVAINRGGTGASTKATAFNALSPMSAAGDVIYGGTSGAGTALAIGTAGQVLTVNSGATAPQWSTPTTGTVTSVGGTGTVNGITLTGTVTSSGNLTLGGTLGSIGNSQLTNSSITFGSTSQALGSTVSGITGVTIDNGAIGGTTPAAVTATTLIGGGGSANYGQITGGATGKAVQFQTLGSDGNVSLAVQPKGTGAIDLAAGSSGVNISNGGTVTAITGTSSGTYTTVPTFTISTPTTAGGTQATGTCAMLAITITLQTGGSNYAIGDTITFTGGTFSAAVILTVATLSGSAVATWTVTSSGTYTVLPTNPISTTSSGSGTGATFNITAWGVRTTVYTITGAGSGYVEQPTITFSSGSATAYATVGSEPTVKSLFGSSTAGLQLATAGGTQFQLADTTSNRWIIAKGATTGGNPSLYASTGIFNLSGASASGINFYSNTVSNLQMALTHTASAVNYVQVTGAATGSGVTISSQGSDSAVNLGFTAKSGGVIRFFTGNGTENFRVNSVSSTVNYISVSGGIAGSSPSFSTAGTDADIDLTFTPKGAGAVRFGTYTASSLLPVAGYITIKDSGGTTRRLLVG